jgi:hypothetical protein
MVSYTEETLAKYNIFFNLKIYYFIVYIYRWKANLRI